MSLVDGDDGRAGGWSWASGSAVPSRLAIMMTDERTNGGVGGVAGAGLGVRGGVHAIRLFVQSRWMRQFSCFSCFSATRAFGRLLKPISIRLFYVKIGPFFPGQNLTKFNG